MKEQINNSITKIKSILNTFSLTEKVIFSVFSVIASLSLLFILIGLNNKFLVSIPENGGSIIEGVIGTPRFINPVIANSNVDRDISSLIYSGLVKVESDGNIIPDLADRFEISEDGLIYDFYISEDAKFHDKEIVTSDDVVYTILKIQDPEIRSPRISEWEGVAIEKVSDRQIRFVLETANPNFIKNTNVGILPKHIWQETPNDAFSLNLYNIEPVGSGAYRLDKIKRDSINIPITYTLSVNKNYLLDKPLINKFIFKFYKNESELVEAIEKGEVNSVSSLSPESLKDISSKDFQIITSSLPRVFGIFINQVESPSLSLKSAREALRLATPKSKIVDEIFNGYADKISSPITGLKDLDFSQDLEVAEQILVEAGWDKNEQGIYTVEVNDETFILSTSISTSNVPELIDVAETVAEEWRKIGADVSVKVFEISDLNQNVIRPRNFETLLFGTVVNSPSDLYSFWHSSRRNDPGLNITSYANIDTDDILEELRNTTEEDISEEQIENLVSEIREDIPAIFLYTPQFTYLVSNKIKGVEIGNIKVASDRFESINNWFINTDKVWKVFNN